MPSSSDSSKTYVIKIGGGLTPYMENIADDILELYENNRIVVVTGGAANLDAELKRLKLPTGRVKTTSGMETRYTTREILDIFTKIYDRNRGELAGLLEERGMQVFSQNGAYKNLLVGERYPILKVRDDGRRRVLRENYAGRVMSANVELIGEYLDRGHVLVTSPPAISYNINPLGDSINVDGDISAAHIAAGLHASFFIILTDVGGLLEDPDDELSLIGYLPYRRLRIAEINYARGRFGQKLQVAGLAFEEGVSVIISDGRIKLPITQAIQGSGTHITMD